MSFARCRSCNAPMFWAKVKPSGHTTPLQASHITLEPLAIVDDEPRGRVQLVRVERDLMGGEEWLVRVLKEDEPADPEKPVWRSHFADCPDAQKWRKD